MRKSESAALDASNSELRSFDLSILAGQHGGSEAEACLLVPEAVSRIFGPLDHQAARHHAPELAKTTDWHVHQVPISRSPALVLHSADYSGIHAYGPTKTDLGPCFECIGALSLTVAELVRITGSSLQKVARCTVFQRATVQKQIHV